MITFQICTTKNRPSARYCRDCGELLTSPPPEKTTKISFSKVREYIFGSPPSLGPGDIAKYLKDEMKKKRLPFYTKVIVPNYYKVKLSSEDYNRIKRFGNRLEELCEELEHLAKQKCYTLLGKIHIKFIRSHHIMPSPVVKSEVEKNEGGQKSTGCHVSGVPLSTTSPPPKNTTKMPFLKVLLDQIEEQFSIIETRFRFWCGGTLEPKDVFNLVKMEMYHEVYEVSSLIPDVYEVSLSEQDYDYLKGIEDRLKLDVGQELSSDLEDFAKRRGYIWPSGRIKVTLKPSLFKRKPVVRSGIKTIRTRKFL
jgi:hypothetical protein